MELSSPAYELQSEKSPLLKEDVDDEETLCFVDDDGNDDDDDDKRDSMFTISSSLMTSFRDIKDKY